MELLIGGITLPNASPASARQRSHRLTFRPPLRYVPVCEHDSSGFRNQPQSNRSKVRREGPG